MPSHSAAATAEERRRQILENAAIKFEFKTGSARYICRVMDRPTLERARSSATTASSSSDSSASSSMKSPVESGASSFVNK